MDLGSRPLRRGCFLVGYSVSEMGTMRLVIQADGKIVNWNQLLLQEWTAAAEVKKLSPEDMSQH